MTNASLTTQDFVLVNRNIFLNTHLFTHDEIQILLLLHTSTKSALAIKERFAMSQTRFQKAISFLMNNGFIEEHSSIYSLGVSADFDSLMRREDKPVGNLSIGSFQDTEAPIRRIQNYRDFIPSVQMPDKVREVTFLIFNRLDWDMSKPFDRIINIPNWIKEARQLIAISGGEMRTIRDAIDLLLEKEYTIQSPRSLIKTVASIKNGSNFSPNKKSYFDEPEVF